MSAPRRWLAGGVVWEGVRGRGGGGRTESSSVGENEASCHNGKSTSIVENKNTSILTAVKVAMLLIYSALSLQYQPHLSYC